MELDTVRFPGSRVCLLYARVFYGKSNDFLCTRTRAYLLLAYLTYVSSYSVTAHCRSVVHARIPCVIETRWFLGRDIFLDVFYHNHRRRRHHE